MQNIRIATLLLFALAACGGPPSDLEVDTTASYTGTPGCPDCDDPCEVTDGPTKLGIWGLPLDVTPPLSSVKVVVSSPSQSCDRTIDLGDVTVVPSTTEWTSTTSPCSVTSPESAQLVIVASSGTSMLDCRLQ